uniref:AB hydrolase-1 domain-containing protein n=1 Tax=Aceria tosichella TaxID=561515 RepID=A0A6G1SAX3_9ACAR
MRKLMHFLERLRRSSSKLHLCLFIASRPLNSSLHEHEHRHRRHYHLPSSSLWIYCSEIFNFHLATLDVLCQTKPASNIHKGTKKCIIRTNKINILRHQNYKSDLAGLASLQQRRYSNSFVPAVLTRNANIYPSSIHQCFFGTNSASRRNKMETSEKLVHSRCKKQIEIRACGRLYSELVKSNPILFSGAPKGDGILFKVDYYDSIDMVNFRQVPTICLLHGSPGQYEDFASLINFLTIRGYRVLAPNFPDYNATYQYSFRHSPRERLDFLLEFFRALDVKKIDMLIGHSGSVYTMFELLDHSFSDDTSNWATTSRDFKMEVRSVGMFCTPSHRLPRNAAITPLRLFSLKLFDYPMLRPLLSACLGWWVKMHGIRNRVDKDNIENLLMSASTVGYSEHNKLEARFGLLKRHKIPSLLVYGSKDRLIDVYRFEQLERDLGVTDQARVKRYRSDGSLEKDRSSSESARQQLVDVSRFEGGGHYVFQRYSNQVNEDVYEFLKERLLVGNEVFEK